MRNLDFRITKNPITGKIEYIGTPIETIQSLDELIFKENEIKPTDVITKGMWNYIIYEIIDLKEKIRQLEKKSG